MVGSKVVSEVVVCVVQEIKFKLRSVEDSVCWVERILIMRSWILFDVR